MSKKRLLSMLLAIVMIITTSIFVFGTAFNSDDNEKIFDEDEIFQMLINSDEIFEHFISGYARHLYNIGQEQRFLDEILIKDAAGVVIDTMVLREIVFEILNEYWGENDDEESWLDVPVDNEVEAETDTEMENQNTEEDPVIIDEENELIPEENEEEILGEEDSNNNNAPVLNILEETEFVFELESPAERVTERLVERERPRVRETRQITATTAGNRRAFDLINENLAEAQIEYETNRGFQATESNFVAPMSASMWTVSPPAPIIDIMPDERLAQSVADRIGIITPWNTVTRNLLNNVTVVDIEGSNFLTLESLRGIGNLQNLVDFSTTFQSVSDLLPLLPLAHHDGLMFVDSFFNQIEVEGRREGDLLIAPNVVRGINGAPISPDNIVLHHGGVWRGGEIVWDLSNIPANQEYVTYFWQYNGESLPNNHNITHFSFNGRVRVYIRPAAPLMEAATVFPAVDLFTRHDGGLNPRHSTHIFVSRGGMEWHQPHHPTANLVIGANDGIAYREKFMRFDLTDEQIQGIMRATGEGGDRILFNLYVTDVIGAAQIRAIDLFLVPANRVGAINTNYFNWENHGGTPRQIRTVGNRWMSALDAFVAGISARDNLIPRGVAPAATSERIFRNMPGVRNTQLNRYFEFDLTDALQAYFGDPANAGERRVGIVLSNIQAGGLVAAATSRAGEDTSPKLTIPVHTPTVPVYPAVDLFVRHDRGISPQSQASYRSYGGLNWQNPRGTDLVIGMDAASSNERGAYRETYMRFDLSSDQIQGILNATGIGDDRAVFRLFVTGRAGTAILRDIDLHLIPGYRVDRIRANYGAWTTQNGVLTQGADTPNGWMSAYDAFRAGITARENFRYYQWSTRPTMTSEPMFYNMPGVPNTRFGKYVEFDLTDALQAYFSDSDNAGRTSFGFVLSILRGNGLVTAASSRQSNANAYRRPRLTVPVNNPREIMELEVRVGEEHDVFISGSNLTSDNEEVIVRYDPQVLEVANLSGLSFRRVLTTGFIDGTNIEIIRFDHNNGIIHFRVNSDVPADKAFSGVLNIVRFRARANGVTHIHISGGRR